MAFAQLSKAMRPGKGVSTPARKRSATVMQRSIESGTGFNGLASVLDASALNAAPTIQTKLEIGEPNDKFEQEAERVADDVMRMPSDGLFGSDAAGGRRISGELSPIDFPPIQRLCSKCSAEQEEPQSNFATSPVQISRLQRSAAAQTAIPGHASVLQRQELGREVDEEQEVIQPKLHESAIQREGLEEEETVRTHSADVTAAANAMQAVGAGVRRLQQGGGSPLPKSVRAFMEPRFGRSFGDVRIHTDAFAADLSSRVHARAFTVGRDVVLNRGEFQPTSSAGLHLLAHELTHVVQQNGGARGQPQRIQCLKNSAANPLNYVPQGKKDELGYIKRVKRKGAKDPVLNPPEIHFPKLSLPDIEGEPKGTEGHKYAPGKPANVYTALVKGKPFQLPKATWRTKFTETGGTAMGAFRAGVGKAQIKTKIDDKIAAQNNVPELVNDQHDNVFYMAVQRSGGKSFSTRFLTQFLIVGTKEQLVDQALVPQWDKSGERAIFDADHAHELQLGGKDSFDNLYLWNQKANRSAGPTINAQIRWGRFEKLMNAAEDDGYFLEPIPAENTGQTANNMTKDERKEEKKKLNNKKRRRRGGLLARARKGKDFKLIFDSVIGGLKLKRGNQNQFWSRDSVVTGKHIKQLSVLDTADATKLGLIGDTNPKFIHIFTGPTGGASARLKIEDFDKNGNIKNPKSTFLKKDAFQGFDISKANINLSSLRSMKNKVDPSQVPVNPAREKGEVGYLEGRMFRRLESRGMIREKEVKVPVYFSRELGFNVYINGEHQFDKGLDGVKAVPFSPIKISKGGIGSDGALRITGDILPMLSLFPKGFSIPFEITGDSISVDVPIDLANQKIGPLTVTEASLKLGADEKGFLFGGEVLFDLEGIGQGRLTAKRLNFEGEFEFDWDFLSHTTTHISYKDGKLYAIARVPVPKGVLPGIESATVNLLINDDGVQFDGDFMLSGSGFPKDSRLILSYDDETGPRIGANVSLTGIPGVENGELSFTATPKEEGGLKVTASGNADLELPGVKGSLELSWDDGLFIAHGLGKVARGNVEGFGFFTITNQSVDDEGKPIEGAIADKFSAMGKATALFHFGPLTGVVGVELTRSGDLKLTDASVEASIDVPLTPKRTLFKKPRAEDKPWILFNKEIDKTFPFKGVPLNFEGEIYVESTAEVTLLPVSLRGRAKVDFNGTGRNRKEILLDPDGVSVPDFTAKAEINDPLLAAKATAMACGSVNIGKKELLMLGIGVTGTFSGDVAAQPKLDGEIYAKKGKLGASLDAGIALTSNLQVEVFLGMPIRVLDMDNLSTTFPLGKIGPFPMASPFQWEHNWQWRTPGEGVDVQIAKPGGPPIFEPTKDDLDQFEDEFDKDNQASEDSGKDVTADKEGGNELLQTIERVSKLVDIFVSGASIFAVIWEQFTCYKPPTPSQILGCITKAPELAEQLLADTEAFYEAVQSAEDEGTLDWLAEELPGGEIAVAVLRKYLWSVEKGYEGISSVAGTLGFHDPVAFEKQFAKSLRETEEAWKMAYKKRRRLTMEGFDRISAETITSLEATSYSSAAKSYMGVGERVKAARLEAAVRKRLAEGSAAELRKEQELLGRGFPKDAAKEIAAIHRLAVVNVTPFRGYFVGGKEYELRVERIIASQATDEAAAQKAFAEFIAEARPIRKYYEGGPLPSTQLTGG